ncbi:recombinase RecQ [Mycobacterium sp. GA-1285]|uniref:RecQ family ATP-dependent DNA helicase n=1 Tax=Mycobacterium sp. GA-1285 TaxID=1772282 RepID=UPI0007490EF1|nr:RecQ family ATP-dependent DNA helicase [Mycobacterium sp. GA-1285]KUI20174.1 recombinase RecQ [Mycobacterium sp. GA-1285]
MNDSDRLRDVAQKVFGWQTLRPEQLEAMTAILDGRDVLAVMPTGSGKSAIYQVPAVLLPRAVIVISPLIALQYDQIAALEESDAPDAVAINSRQGAKALDRAWAAVERGEVRYVFLGPEQLMKDDVMKRLAAVKPSLVVVDEAHCVSAWGHEFRPTYLRVGDAIERLGRPPVAALTATASAVVRREIADFLGLREPTVIAGGFDRPNISLDVRHHIDDARKRQDVLDLVQQLARPGLLYCATRRDTEFYAEQLTQRGVSAVSYHAGLNTKQRNEVHDGFRDDEVGVVVATSAFGMGIDKPNVRFVVHASVPVSVDAYYQQIGRAGRDDGPADAILFYRAEDLTLGNFYATRNPDEELLRRVYGALDVRKPKRLKQIREELGERGRRLTSSINLLEQAGAVESARSGFTSTGMRADDAVRRAVEMAEIGERVDRTRVEMMRSYAETPDCRRQFLLAYFGDYLPEACGNCDRCRDHTATDRGESAIAMGTAVEHREWGAGTVLGGDADRITVLFDLYGYRTLDVDAVRHNDLLDVRAASSPA